MDKVVCRSIERRRRLGSQQADLMTHLVKSISLQQRITLIVDEAQ